MGQSTSTVYDLWSYFQMHKYQSTKLILHVDTSEIERPKFPKIT